MPQPRTITRISELGLLYAAAVWGSTFIVVKAALAHVDPSTLVAYRFTIASLLMAGYLVFLKRPMWARLKAGVILGVVLGILYLTQTIGLVYTSASNSGFITGLFVVFVPLLGWLCYRKRITIMQALAVALALAGLWLLTGGIAGANVGDIITLAAAITYAVHVLMAGRYMESGTDPLALNFQQMLVTGLFAWLAVGAFQRSLLVTSAATWWWIVFLAVIPTLSAFLIQLYAQRHVDPTRTSLIFTMEPVFAAVFAWTLGGEELVPVKAAGGLLIVAAMIVSELKWDPLELVKGRFGQP